MAWFEINYDYWRIHPEISVRDLASIMRGIDPRAIHEVVINAEGDRPDLSNEIAVILANIHLGNLRCAEDVRINEAAKVSVSNAIDWLRTIGLKSVARNLSVNIHQEDGPILKKEQIVKKHERDWKSIVEDFKRSRENGLFVEAAHSKSGLWLEGAALQWAKEHGKLKNLSIAVDALNNLGRS